jgi:hypothetical protein
MAANLDAATLADTINLCKARPARARQPAHAPRCQMDTLIVDAASLPTVRRLLAEGKMALRKLVVAQARRPPPSL